MATKRFKFDNMDGNYWRSVGKDVRRSLERAASVSGMDGVTVKGIRYSLLGSSELERAAQAIERTR